MSNLNRFDLNLLVALDALLSERSVTRAADRLCITQPALSGSLQRLRYHFDDHLLVRIGRQMELTPKARALIEPVRAALLQINRALETQAIFDPRTSERTFRVAMSDYCVYVFLPHVVRKLAVEAPGTRLVTEDIFGPSFSRLEGGDIDLIVAHGDRRLFGREGVDADLLSTDLFEDSFVCVVAADHPVGDEMTMEDYLHYPHALTDFGAKPRTIEEADIKRQGIVIKAKFLIPSFGGPLFLLAGSQLIATVQSKLVQLLAPNLNVRMLKPPVELAMLQETLIWHKRNNDDPGHMWLRGLLLEAGQGLS